MLTKFKPAMAAKRAALRFGATAAIFAAIAGAAFSGAAQAAELPKVPTTRIMAIGHLTAKATPEAVGALLPEEVRQTVQLNLDGKIDQWFVRKDQNGVVFFLTIVDLKEARATLERLPLGQAGLMEFDLIPLGPLSPLGLLIAPQGQPAGH